MTNAQKTQITKLRAEGKSYAAIAEALGLSQSTVASFCRRNSVDVSKCEQCGKGMPPSKQKNRRFCSDKCRISWWNAHPTETNSDKQRTAVCPRCGKTFTYPQSRKRTFCSRQCYIGSKAVAR